MAEVAHATPEADPELATIATGIDAWSLLRLTIPAVLIGIGSSVTLVALSVVASRLEDVVWTTVPTALGIEGTSAAWIIATLTLTGLLVGLLVTIVPGHAGPDPATTELGGRPLPLFVLPGLALALILTLAGGVSLGPENPIIGINVGLAVALGARLAGRWAIAPPIWAGLAFSGTIGAMFGTPLAAALLLSENADDPRIPLWDRLFGPLVAAAAAAITTAVIHAETFTVPVEPYPQAELQDVVSGSLIAVGAAVFGLAAVYAFPLIHRAFRRLGPPLIAITAGGFVLGLLGAIGGDITLFKGLQEMQRLAAEVDRYTAVELASMAVIKVIALMVASCAGFRGGRIFPAVFAAVALGLAVHAAVPGVPQAVAVSGALVGILLAVTRSGWLAIFMSALLVGSVEIIPILVIMVLPTWLVVTGRPHMVAEAPTPAREAAGPAAA